MGVNKRFLFNVSKKSYHWFSIRDEEENFKKFHQKEFERLKSLTNEALREDKSHVPLKAWSKFRFINFF